MKGRSVGRSTAKRKKSSLPRWRLASQLAALVALNPGFYRFHGLCIPVLNCWSCPLAAFGCPVGVMGKYLAVGLIPLMTIGTIVVAGAAFGRLLCGWACPFGLLQDGLFRIRTRKLALPGFLRYGKYVFLVGSVLVVGWFFGMGPTPERAGPEDGFFCNYCPAGTLEAAIPRVTMQHIRTAKETRPAAASASAGLGQGAASGGPGTAEGTAAVGDVVSIRGAEGRSLVHRLVTSPRVWILAAFLVAFVLIKRPFCRAMCPIGAALALFNKVSLYRMRFWPEKCVQCGRCKEVCPVDFYFPGDPNAPECIRCLECKSACPTGAIR